MPVELGASIFVDANRILYDAIRQFNLSTDDPDSQYQHPGPELGVWDGQTFVLTLQNGGRWDAVKLLWKYGWAPAKTNRLMKSIMGKFLQMYEEPVFPFTSLSQAVQDLGLQFVTATTGAHYLMSNGVTGEFGREVLQASTRLNYAQNLEHIHGVEAMVCMAGEGGASVAGGNWKIFESTYV